MAIREAWRRVKCLLPIYRELARIDERLSALERPPDRTRQADQREICPKCGLGRLVFVSEEPHSMLGIVGVLNDTLRCDKEGCGHVLVRQR